MFSKQDKWDKWWDSLPAHTKEYLKTQAVWHDVDLFKAMFVGAVIGFLIGLLV